jgi:hypothetical protein
MSVLITLRWEKVGRLTRATRDLNFLSRLQNWYVCVCVCVRVYVVALIIRF